MNLDSLHRAVKATCLEGGGLENAVPVHAQHSTSVKQVAVDAKFYVSNSKIYLWMLSLILLPMGIICCTSSFKLTYSSRHAPVSPTFDVFLDQK